jgi:hypothetical protein
LEEKVAAPIYETTNTAVGIRRADHATLREMLIPTSATSGGRSFGIVRSRTKATEFIILFSVLKGPRETTTILV